jgi:peptidoglycan hydrolase CwlO-like protein
MQSKTSIEQLEELKAAAFLKTWQEQLMKLRDKDQRIAELEEEVKNLTDDCNRMMKERNEYLHQATDAIRELDRQRDELKKLQGILDDAPESIQNYFAKKGKH